ncbi:IS200/IS605 family transposase [Phascolarctobacterium sp. Marseille-Q4147]|uniref:IS200/IS605 family transposase n=1 Tax=Phascolarctobacterium sp. Marseille-Q4147 TaxID=2823317 RepID=UPI001B32C367|nr:IS200/IS605 family transposase [Phascolarctobacterium sp. Marseille-Q4147]QTV78892.1 IS200/IS605 family transposase [Phascolarctobacterium sp. Marseille-Q4147]
MIYKSNYNIVYSCKYHIVFCPKYRRKVLVNGVDTRLKELVNSICEELHVDIIEMEIMPDYVHILLGVDPQFGIHKAVKTIKGTTSRILRQEFPWLRSQIPRLWTNSYFCSTIGGAPLSVIKQYIENQKSK